MNLILTLLLLWLVVIPAVILACAGLWTLIEQGWKHWALHRKLEALWEEPAFGARTETQPTPWAKLRIPSGDPGPDSPWDWAS